MTPSVKPPSTDAPAEPRVGRPNDTPVDFSLTKAGPLTLLEAERQLFDQFAQEQFLLLRQTRERLLADQQAIEQTLETRRKELDAQTRDLANRVQELRDREHRLNQEEEAIPERHGSMPVAGAPAGQENERASPAGPSAAEMEELRKQLQERQRKLQQARAERDAAWEELRRLRDQQQELERLKAERDAAVAQARRPQPAPPDYAKFEREFAVLHRQLDAERRRLAEEAQDLHLCRLDLQKKTDSWQEDVAKDQARLQQLAEELTARQHLIDQDRRQLEQNERELEQRLRDQRLREVELRELREIAERDNARERSELMQERVRIARLREALRLEQEAFRTDVEQPARAGDPPGRT